MKNVLNVLIAAIQPQRFLDQVSFSKKISLLDSKVNIYFFISDEVYNIYYNIVDELEEQVINRKNLKRNKIIADDYISKFFIRLKVLCKNIKYTKLFTYRFINLERNYLLNLNEKYNKILVYIKKFDIQIILVNGDRHLGYEPIFLKIAKKLKIPSIIVYLVDYADEERIFRYGLLTKKIVPNIFTSDYIKISQEKFSHMLVRNSYYYPHPIANALDKFGVLTNNPYVMGCGSSDILCLNNEYYRERYIEKGVNADKIRVVGDGSYDEIYNKFMNKDNIRKSLIQNYKLDGNKDIILIALPQLAEHNILSWDKHWEEIEFLISNLNELDKNIIVSLHPKMKISNYSYLEKKYNCNILNERLADVLPAVDLYVATYSSTVVWGVLCGIKTIVIDFYDFNYTMYDFLDSITKISDKHLFLKIIVDALSRNIDFSHDWLKLSREQVFDGNVTKRYIELIRSINND